MKRLVLLVGLVLLSLVGTTATSQAYYLDTPHNESNGIYCNTCHSLPAFWLTAAEWAAKSALDPEDTLANKVCLECHAEGSTNTKKGPKKMVHSARTTGSAVNTWSTNCTQCHDAHFQGQLDWKSEPRLFLAYGDFSVANGVLKYGPANAWTSIGIANVVADDPFWENTATWNSKGGFIPAANAVDGSRGLVLVPNYANPTETFEIIDVTNGVIKVKGKMVNDLGVSFGVIYGQSLKSLVAPNGATSVADYRDVKFFVPTLVTADYGGYADLTPGVSGGITSAPVGLCQVCHTTTSYWRNDGTNAPGQQPHNPDTACATCHAPPAGFPPVDHKTKIVTYNSGGVNCSSCHTFTDPVSGLHAAAVNASTGGVKCAVCHDSETSPTGLNVDVAGRLGVTPQFKDDTGVWPVNCAGCHSDKPQKVTDGLHPSGHAATDFAWDGNCADCHGPNTLEVQKGLHQLCTTCHDLSGTNGYTVRKAGDLANGSDGTAVGATTTSTCTGCHGANASGAITAGTIHHVSKNNLALTSCTTSCHGTANHKGNHATNAIKTDLNCNSCHLDATIVGGNGASVGAPIDPLNNKVHDDCTTCHNTDATLKTLAQVGGTKVIAMPNPTSASTDGGGTCTACHGAYFANHTMATSAAPTPGTDHYTSRVTNSCSGCHTTTAVGVARKAVSSPFTAVGDVHAAGCFTCHQATGILKVAPPKALGMVSGSHGGSCNTCHITASVTWTTIHKTPVMTGTAATAHAGKVTVNANCTSCHTATTPGASALAKDAILSPFTETVGEVHNTQGCATCHDATTGATRPIYGRAIAITGGGSCSTCHINATTKTWALVHTPFATAEHADLNTTPSCVTSCHASSASPNSNARLAQTAPYVAAGNVHATGCALCHDTNNGARINGVNGKGNASVPGTAGKWACSDCHTKTWVADHSAATGLNPVAGVSHASNRVDALATCTSSCHTATAGGASGVMPVDNAATVNKVHNYCVDCHDSATGALRAANTVYGNKVIAKGDCGTCHGAAYFDSHVHGTGTKHKAVFSATVDLSQSGGDNYCYKCHDDAGLGKNTNALSTFAAINTEHATVNKIAQTSSCATCHNYATVGNQSGAADTPLLADVTAALANHSTNTTCTGCHKEKLYPAASAVHGGHSSGDFAWTTATQASCGGGGVVGNCHDYTVNNDVVVKVHSNTCGLCHSDPAGGGPRRVGTDADATLAGTDPTVACTVCHALKPTISGMHHDTALAATNKCTTCHITVNHSTFITDPTNSCNAVFCHAPVNFDGTNDSAIGTQPVATLVDPVNPMKHDACRTCHTFNATTLAGMLNTSTGKKGITTLVAGPCSGCHTQAVGSFHHLNVNTTNGACTQCHNDPRNDAYTASTAYTVVNAAKPSNAMVCDECHVTPLANATGYTGSMTVSAWNEGGTHSTTTYAAAFTRTVANSGGHVIPNTAGTIDNYGICFSCHDGAAEGKATTQINVLHAQPTAVVPTCSARYTPGNPIGTTSSLGRFYFLGNSWRPTATGSGNCSADLPSWASAATVSSGIRGAVASLTVPDPWNTTATKVVPVWATPPTAPTKIAAPVASDIQVSSAILNGTTLTVTATTTGTCGNMLLVYTGGNVAFSGTPCVATKTGYVIATNGATVNVTDSTAGGVDVIGYPITLPASPPAGTIALSASSYTVSEAGGTVTITANRTGGSTGAVTVNYATSDGTATTANSDYVAKSGTLSWTAGDMTSKTFAVTITNDATVEPDEIFNVTLSGVTGGAALGTSTAQVTITNDDVSPAGTIALSASSYTVSEAGGTVTITATRTGGSTGAVTVNYATSDGTATTANSDYVAKTGTLTWATGVTTSQTFTVTITNDTTVEPDEIFNVTLSGITGGATLGTPNTAPVTITNDDNAGTIALSAATYSVGEAGPTVTITATRTGGSSGAVGISYATSDDDGSNGTPATAGSDYTAKSGTLSWANGVTTSQTFTVSITQDTLYEGDEVFDVTLSTPTGGAGLSIPNTAVVTIVDDEAAPQHHVFAWTTGATGTQTTCGGGGVVGKCHNYTVNTDVVTMVHSNTCGLCHSDPLGGGPRRVGTDADATLAGNDGGVACTVCHAVKPTIGGMHHDTAPAATNSCTTCHDVVNHSTFITDPTNSCNAVFCHAPVNFDGTNDSAIGTQPVATLVDPANPMKHDACRTCHTFNATTLAGILNTSTGKKGITTLVAGPCNGCHTQAVATFHHLNVNTTNGACTQCHNDPRNDAYTASTAYTVVNASKPTNAMVCDECHVTPLANATGYTGSMTISAWNEGGTHSTTTYAAAFTRTVANSSGHVIPNTAGTIDNYGICFSCHDGAAEGKATTQINVLHAQPTAVVPTCSARYTPGNPIGTTSSLGRFYFLGNSWRPTATGSGNCSADLPSWASAATVSAGIRGAVASLTVPDPWNTTATKVVPVWATPPTAPVKIAAPVASDIKVSSAVLNGTTLTVTATTTGTCGNMLLVYTGGNVAFSGAPCVATKTGYVIATNGATVNVTDSTAGGIDVIGYPISLAATPGTIALSAATYSVGEAGGTVTITATRTGGSSGAVGISYATSNGTATAGSDYTASSGTLSWTAADTASKTFTVPILQDAVVEGSEIFNVTLSTPTGGATLGTPSTAQVTILDDEPSAAGTIALSAATYSVGEAGPTVTITATRTGGSTGAVGISYATSDGDGVNYTAATAGSDYTAKSGTLSWATGVTTSQTFTVAITQDTVYEPGDESFFVTLSTPTGGANLGTPSTAEVTIVDDDTAAPHHVFAWTTGATGTQTTCGGGGVVGKCHDYTVNTDVVSMVHSNTCGLCHSDPLGGGPRRVGTDADATLAGNDGGVACTVCHAVKPTIGGMHHDTPPASNNSCTTCHDVVNHSTFITDPTNSCNAVFCHAPVNFDGTNDSAIGTQPVATLVDPANPMKHDACRTCHTFNATTFAGTLNASTGKKGITTLVAGPCNGCHTQAVGSFHHLNVNTTNGACTQCHNDPRNDAYTASTAYTVVNASKPTNNMVCDECHVTPLANATGYTGSMTISAWNEGGTHSTTTYAAAFTRTVANSSGHVIPNTAGTIDNYGICFSCHDGAAEGKATTQINVLHAQPTAVVPTCSARYTPGNPVGTTSSLGRFYFLGNSWRPTATGSGNCSADLPSWASAATVSAGIRGAVASLTVPDPWNTTATKVVPVWASAPAAPAKAPAPVASDIKVTSAVLNGTTLTVTATTTGTCGNLRYVDNVGSLTFAGTPCTITRTGYAEAANGKYFNVTDSVAGGVDVIGYRIGGIPAPAPPAVAALDPWTNISATAPAASNGTVAAGNVTVGSGSNRMLLVAIVTKWNGATTTPTFGATLGGTALTMIAQTPLTAQEAVWLGYLNDSAIGTGAKALSVTYGNTGGTVRTASSIHVKWASYTGVNQTTPAYSFTSAYLTNTAATIPTTAAVNYITNGMTVAISGDGVTATASTIAGTPTLTPGTFTANGVHSSNSYVSAVHTSTSSYASGNIVASWTFTGTHYKGLVVASLQP